MRLKDIFIAEAQDYSQMFNDVLKYKPNTISTDKEAEVRGQIYSYISEIVFEAKQKLKRNDRIVWLLRYAKIAAWGFWASAESPNAVVTVLAAKPYVRQIADLITDGDMTAEAIAHHFGLANSIYSIISRISHYLSLDYAPMANYVFSRQDVLSVYTTFAMMEEDWKEKQKSRVDYNANPNKKVVLDFKNGWMWVDLGEPYCRLEGGAMGHCGNSAAYKDTDTVLSLRELKTENGKQFWVPHLTFILRDGGMLGEMKGRGNNKPSPKYHDMIFALLMSDIVTGIKGGGYAPQNNFKLSDLPDEQREQAADKLTHFEETLAMAVYQGGLNEETGDRIADEYGWEYNADTNTVITDEVAEVYAGLENIWPDKYNCMLSLIGFYANKGVRSNDPYDDPADALEDFLYLTGVKSYGSLVGKTAMLLDKISPEKYKTLDRFDNNLPLFDYNVFQPGEFIKQETEDGDNHDVIAASKLVGMNMIITRIKAIVEICLRAYDTGPSDVSIIEQNGQYYYAFTNYDFRSMFDGADGSEDDDEIERAFDPRYSIRRAIDDSGISGRLISIEGDDEGFEQPSDVRYTPDIMDKIDMDQYLNLWTQKFITAGPYEVYIKIRT